MSGRTLRIALACALIAAGSALTGCASSAQQQAARQGPTSSDVYVHRINEAADRQGMTDVIWVNPPRGGEAARITYSLQATVGDEDEEKDEDG
ncbi:hypothetical protein HFP89_02080 [Wenzhouxiangella sp. XN79A]|uniref:hypothetical protein n=1 Tax=Wenzhouxiangella sp. XN79A TaxID=2724193 RepID=UPI00144AF7A6|nr:hypothetical protein [Wenzhouxiangella sp. XN79A]NKI33953.1 hypothetical protein [Wenzhouxiangella sp. XN79A]